MNTQTANIILWHTGTRNTPGYQFVLPSIIDQCHHFDDSQQMVQRYNTNQKKTTTNARAHAINIPGITKLHNQQFVTIIIENDLSLHFLPS